METLRETAPLISSAATFEHDTLANGVRANGRLRGFRNGLPAAAPYAWRGRRYDWAAAVIAAAEREHGEPYPVCQCGVRLIYNGGYGRCPRCRPLPVT